MKGTIRCIIPLAILWFISGHSGLLEREANGIRISHIGMFPAFICLARGWSRAGANGNRAPQTQHSGFKGKSFCYMDPICVGNPITAGFLYLPLVFYAAFCSKCLFRFDNPGTNKVSPPALISQLAAFQFVSVSSELDSLLITPTGSYRDRGCSTSSAPGRYRGRAWKPKLRETKNPYKTNQNLTENPHKNTTNNQ